MGSLQVVLYVRGYVRRYNTIPTQEMYTTARPKPNEL
jgi:hypothetical protein